MPDSDAAPAPPLSAAIPSALVGQTVVLDTADRFVYIGRVAAATTNFVELEEADVHDSSESPSPRELYVLDARKYGVKKNRARVFVRAEKVVSVSKLEDVIDY